MMRYVVGFAIDDEDSRDSRVLLVRKAKPEWQAGFLNGVGGKIERLCPCPDEYDSCGCRWETPVAAMVREFHEETGRRLHANLWSPVATIRHPDAEIHVFRCQMSAVEMGLCLNTEGQGEVLEVHRVEEVIAATMGGLDMDSVALANVPWLLALACYRGDVYQPITVFASSAEVTGR